MINHSTEESFGRLSKKEAEGCKLILSTNKPWKVIKCGKQIIREECICEYLIQRTVFLGSYIFQSPCQDISLGKLAWSGVNFHG